eukprot:s2141_g11.t1
MGVLHKIGSGEGEYAEYTSWLQQLAGTEGAGLTVQQMLPAPNQHGEMPAWALPGCPDATIGFRSVGAAALKEKIQNLCLAQTWRAWDTLEICSLEEDPELIGFWKGHHRICALHVVGWYCYTHVRDRCPGWLRTMLAHVPVHYHGKHPRFMLVLEGLTRTAALQESVKLHWISIVRAIRQLGEMMNAIKAQRPELYKKVTDWQTINKVLTRVPDTVVVEIELWSLVE